MTNSTSSRPLTLPEARFAAQVISQAFMDDPLIKYMLPLRLTRFQTLIKYFHPMTELGIKNNRLIYGVGEPLQGVAYWKSPENQTLGISVKTLPKFLPLVFTLFPAGFLRAKAIIEKTEAMHDQHTAGEPHYYLENLGVLASARGRGFSSQLIRPVLALADERKVSAYVDTVNPVNVPIYEHFGFRCVEEAPIPGTGITVFGLKRPVQ